MPMRKGGLMITVIASIHVKLGTRERFLNYFKRNIPNVLKDRGCIEYYPAIDSETDFSAQELDNNVVTIIEKWESIKALQEHMCAPHMAVYRENVKDIVEKVVLKVLKNA